VKVGAAGNLLPDPTALLKQAQRAEAAGYDSLWWPDHLMGWYPEAIWTPDLADVAAYQPNPHTYLDCMTAMAAVAVHTERVTIGPSVTEAIRRPPAVLAQQLLSLHHLSRGRAVLGIGAGEAENIEPYGMDFSRPAAKLAEAIEIIRLLWHTDEPVSRDGEFWTLRDAVLGMAGAENEGRPRFPPILVAAHGPRLLELTGRVADGWIPIGLTPEQYADGMARITAAAAAAGRDLEAEGFEPALWSYALVAETHEEAHRLLEFPLVKAYALVLPADAYERRGHAHPLGDSFYGLRDYVPTRYGREEGLAALEAIPHEVVHDFVLHGTPDDLVATARRYESAGMRHFIPWNITFFAEAARTKSSFRLLDEMRAQLAA
jgi:phthiodiolone/phenolphthiodiolone dimycocerosates ketoreductase